MALSKYINQLIDNWTKNWTTWTTLPKQQLLFRQFVTTRTEIFLQSFDIFYNPDVEKKFALFVSKITCSCKIMLYIEYVDKKC